MHHLLSDLVCLEEALVLALAPSSPSPSSLLLRTGRLLGATGTEWFSEWGTGLIADGISGYVMLLFVVFEIIGGLTPRHWNGEQHLLYQSRRLSTHFVSYIWRPWQRALLFLNPHMSAVGRRCFPMLSTNASCAHFGTNDVGICLDPNHDNSI